MTARDRQHEDYQLRRFWDYVRLIPPALIYKDVRNSLHHNSIVRSIRTIHFTHWLRFNYRVLQGC
jgi:hypothetical protein